MIGAIIAGAAALAVMAAGYTILALALRSAEQRAAEARVADATKAGKIAIDEATIATLNKALDAERWRTNALDKALEDAAESGDAGGARDRVLQRWRAQAGHDTGAAGDPGAGGVSGDPAAGAAESGDDRGPARC